MKKEYVLDKGYGESTGPDHLRPGTNLRLSVLPITGLPGRRSDRRRWREGRRDDKGRRGLEGRRGREGAGGMTREGGRKKLEGTVRDDKGGRGLEG